MDCMCIYVYLFDLVVSYLSIPWATFCWFVKFHFYVSVFWSTWARRKTSTIITLEKNTPIVTRICNLSKHNADVHPIRIHRCTPSSVSKIDNLLQYLSTLTLCPIKEKYVQKGFKEPDVLIFVHSKLYGLW